MTVPQRTGQSLKSKYLGVNITIVRVFQCGKLSFFALSSHVLLKDLPVGFDSQFWKHAAPVPRLEHLGAAGFLDFVQPPRTQWDQQSFGERLLLRCPLDVLSFVASDLDEFLNSMLAWGLTVMGFSACELPHASAGFYLLWLNEQRNGIRMDVHVRGGYGAEVPLGLFSVDVCPPLHQKRALTKLVYPRIDQQLSFKLKHPILLPNGDSSDVHNLISIIISGLNLNVWHSVVQLTEASKEEVNRGINI